MQPVRWLLTISGEVHGVGYRFFAQIAAQRLGLVGRVRNLPAGRVEIVAQGQLPEMEAFERQLREGPPYSTVESVERAEMQPGDDFDAFHIIR